MRRTILILIYGSLLLASASCSKTEQANNNAAATPSASASPSTEAKTPPANIVTASAAEVQVAPGGSAEAAVQLSISAGYHINANPASAKYLIATTLDVEPDEGITVGQAKYPPSVTRKFAFSPDPLAVYEGQPTIKVPLKVAANVARGTRTLSGKLRVQPCDDQACYPPRSIAVSLSVMVK
jgi:hypothetical protein